LRNRKGFKAGEKKTEEEKSRSEEKLNSLFLKSSLSALMKRKRRNKHFLNSFKKRYDNNGIGLFR